MERVRPAYPLDVSLKEALLEIGKGLPALARLLWKLMRDSRTPLPVKIWIGGTALYIISPFNFKFRKGSALPFKLLNRVDDIVLILVALQKTFEKTPYELLESNWNYSMPLREWSDLVFKVQTDIKQFR